MKNLAKQTAHLISRNILSTAAVLTLMGAAAFAAAPVGGYQPGETLNPDCSPTDVDCKVVFTQAPNKFIDGTTATDAVFTGGNVGIGTDSPNSLLELKNGTYSELTFKGTDHTNVLSEAILSIKSSKVGGYINIDADGGDGNDFVLRNGKTGIGTIVPLAKLHVVTDGASGDAFKITDGTNTDVVVTEDGNVGIGTTAPSFPLHISSGHGIKVDSVDNSWPLWMNSPGGAYGGFYQPVTSGSAEGTWLYMGDNDGYTVKVDPKGESYFNGGNVGIGTSTPSQKLHVQGSYLSSTVGRLALFERSEDHGLSEIGIKNKATSQGLYSGINADTNFVESYGEGSNSYIYSSSENANGMLMFSGAGPLSFGAGKVFSTGVDMTILPSGNVGIGTTVPTAQLDILSTGGYKAGINISSTDSVNAQSILKFTNNAGSAGKSIIETNVPLGIIGGNVGIGTITPAEKLDIRGESPTVLLRSTGTGARGLWTSIDDTNEMVSFDSSFNNSSAYPIVYKFGGVERVRMTPEGNVGIGTTTPSNDLHIAGDVSNAGFQNGSENQLLISGKGANATKNTLVGFETENDYGYIQTLDRGVSFSTYNLALQPKGGNVGIGSSNVPVEKLHVNGAAIVGNTINACSTTNAGAIKFNAGQFQGCTGTAWVNLH